MKAFNRLLVALSLCLSVAHAGEHGGAVDTAKLEKTLRTAFVLGLAEDLGLNDQQTLELLGAYRQQAAAVAELRARQAQVRSTLMSGDAADTASSLQQLLEVDKQLADAVSEGAQQVGASLAPEQRAQVYLLLTTLDDHVQAVMGENIPRAHPHSAKAQGDTVSASSTVPDTSAPPAEPQVLVLQAIQAWADGLKLQNVEKMMAPFSEQFQHYEYGDKAGVRNFLKQAADMGYLEGIEVATEEAEVTVEGEDATVYPVRLSGNFGDATIEFKLKHEDGSWRIVNMTMTGV